MRAIEFSIPGQPCGKGRPRFSTAGRFPRAYTPEKTARFENLVKLAYASTEAGMLEGAVRLTIRLYFQIPESRSRKDKQGMESGAIYPETKPDIDNCVKAIMDGLNGTAFPDDKHVVQLIASKRYARVPRTDVRIEPIKHRTSAPEEQQRLFEEVKPDAQ